MELAWREAIGAGGTDHVGRQALLEFDEQAENARHPANTISNFAEKLSGRARTESVQVLNATLQAEPVEGVQADHVRAFQPHAAVALMARFR
jgi:hypothetical protein